MPTTAFRPPTFPSAARWPRSNDLSALPPYSLAAPNKPVYLIRAGTGNDANPGNLSRPWATFAPLLSAIGSTITAAGTPWKDVSGNAKTAAGITTANLADAADAAIQTRQWRLQGGTVLVDTRFAKLSLAQQLAMPAGWELIATSPAGQLGIDSNYTVSDTFTQQGAPNTAVYGSTGTGYARTAIYETSGGVTVQLDPIGGNSTGTTVPNLATALPLLQARPGSFYWDPATGKVYVRTSDGTSPQSNGRTYTAARDLFGTGGGRLITITDGQLYGLSLGGGFGFQASDSNVYGHSLYGADNFGSISVFRKMQGRYAGRHTFSVVGSGLTGLIILRGCTATLGPGGVFSGAWNHYVLNPATGGTGSIQLIEDSNVVVAGQANVNAAGGNDATGNQNATVGYNAWDVHNSAGGVQIARRKLTNCSYKGAVTLGAAETAAVTSGGNAIGDEAAVVGPNWTSVGDTLRGRLPTLDGGTFALSGVNWACDGTYSGVLANIKGTISLAGTIDLRAGLASETAWHRNGTVALTINGLTLYVVNNPANGLLDAYTVGTDSLAVSNLTLLGPPGVPMVKNYNATGLAKTWYDLFALGLLTSGTHNGIAFAVPPSLAGILASDQVELFDLRTAEQWQDSAFNTLAATNGNPVSTVAGVDYGWPMVANSNADRPTLAAQGAQFGAAAGGMTAAAVSLGISTGYAIVLVEQLTGTTTNQGRRTVQSETLGNRIMSITRGDGNPYFVGSLVSNFRIAPDNARHVAVLNAGTTGNFEVWVDGVNKTTGTVAVADWGQVSLGKGNGGAGAVAEFADTTVRALLLVKRKLTPTEIASIQTWATALP